MTRGTLDVLGRLLMRDQIDAEEFENWLCASAESLGHELGEELHAELAFVDVVSKQWRSETRTILHDSLSEAVRDSAIGVAKQALADTFSRELLMNLKAVERDGSQAESQLAALYRQYCDGAHVLRNLASSWGVKSEIDEQERAMPSPWAFALHSPDTDPRALAREAILEIDDRGVSYRLNDDALPGALRFIEISE